MSIENVYLQSAVTHGHLVYMGDMRDNKPQDIDNSFFFIPFEALRKKHKLSIEKVSEIAGISRDYYMKLKTNERRINSDVMSTLVKVFGVSLESLLSSTKKEEKMIPVVGMITDTHVRMWLDEYTINGHLDELDKVGCPSSVNPDGAGALVVEGSAYEPALCEGYKVIYRRKTQGIDYDNDNIDPEAIGMMAVVMLQNGDTVIRKLKNGSSPHLFQLHSINRTADAEIDVPIQWAAKVLAIIPDKPEKSHDRKTG